MKWRSGGAGLPVVLKLAIHLAAAEGENGVGPADSHNQMWGGSPDPRRAPWLGCRTGGPTRARAPAPPSDCHCITRASIGEQLRAWLQNHDTAQGSRQDADRASGFLPPWSHSGRLLGWVWVRFEWVQVVSFCSGWTSEMASFGNSSRTLETAGYGGVLG